MQPIVEPIYANNSWSTRTLRAKRNQLLQFPRKPLQQEIQSPGPLAVGLPQLALHQVEAPFEQHPRRRAGALQHALFKVRRKRALRVRSRDEVPRRSPKKAESPAAAVAPWETAAADSVSPSASSCSSSFFFHPCVPPRPLSVLALQLLFLLEVPSRHQPSLCSIAGSPEHAKGVGVQVVSSCSWVRIPRRSPMLIEPMLAAGADDNVAGETSRNEGLLYPSLRPM